MASRIRWAMNQAELVGDAERAVQLVGADMPFLLEVIRWKACSHLCRAIWLPLHDRFHGDGEILAALFLGAAVHARALGLVGMADHAAMRADRAVRPQDAFQILAGALRRR